MTPTRQLERSIPQSRSSDPVWLDQPGAVWMVESGHVNLFAVRLRSDGTTGARRHLARIEAGSAFFGFDTGSISTRWTVIAQPSPETRMVRSDRESMPFPVPLVDGWTLCLASAVSHGIEPVEYVPLKPGTTVDVPQNPVPMSGAEPVVWIRHARGEGRLLGNADLVLNGDRPFPLARPTWIEEQPWNRVLVATTAQAFDAGDGWAGIDLFHETIFRVIVQDEENRELKEQARIEKRRQHDERRFDQSMRSLVDPIGGASGRKRTPEAGHPLVRACQAIGAVQQITFMPPTEVLRGLAMHDPVRSMCRSSAVRSRRVVLDESWYHAEGTPLLGFRESDQRPVALLPTRRGYDIFDPVDDTRTRVTPKIAASLQPFAYTFYRPFHSKPVTLKYLCLFGLSGAWSETIFVLALGLAGGLLGMVTPILTANVFDTIIPGAQRQRMVETALFLLAATLASTLLGLSRSFVLLRIENKVETKVQAAVFDRLLSLPAQFFRKYTAGELAQRASAISAIRQMLTSSATSALFSAVFSAFNFVVLFRFSLELALVAVVLTFIQVAVYVAVSLFDYHMQRTVISTQNNIAGLMLQLIGGMSKLRVSGTEKRAFSVWAKTYATFFGFGVRATKISNAVGVFNSAFPLLTSVIIYYVTGQLMADPKFSVSTGSFIAFGSAYGTFSGGLISLVSVVMGLLSIGPIYESAKPILETAPETDPSKPIAGELNGHIELTGVSFRYQQEGPEILKEISLSILPGQFVAFVGPSGSGKSTIFRMLLGFEKPEAGTVLYDRQDLANLDIASVRQQMGVVLQNSTVFSGDIFQNIVCSAPYTLDQAWEAARLAGFEQDLKAMPMGMHTIIGDAGSGLSGGQRQRLMIARAIVGKPRIVLFDEATSALDNQTQAIVSRSLESMRATRVVIAHRLSTVMQADRIFVIDKGRLVQSGTYQELLNELGPFAELAKRQLT